MIIAHRLSVLQISSASSSAFFFSARSGWHTECAEGDLSNLQQLEHPASPTQSFPNEADGEGWCSVRSDTQHHGFCQGAT